MSYRYRLEPGPEGWAVQVDAPAKQVGSGLVELDVSDAGGGYVVELTAGQARRLAVALHDAAEESER